MHVSQVMGYVLIDVFVGVRLSNGLCSNYSFSKYCMWQSQVESFRHISRTTLKATVSLNFHQGCVAHMHVVRSSQHMTPLLTEVQQLVVL